MADYQSERFRGAQLLGNWILGVGYACFFLVACLLVVFIAVLSQGNALVSFFSFVIAGAGILMLAITGLMFIWASFALRVIVAIEHNTHVAAETNGGQVTEGLRQVIR